MSKAKLTPAMRKLRDAMQAGGELIRRENPFRENVNPWWKLDGKPVRRDTCEAMVDCGYLYRVKGYFQWSHEYRLTPAAKDATP